MPTFLDTFVFNLEKACYGAGLFCNGVVMWYHPIKGAPVVDLIFTIICHIAIYPLLSIGFSYLLKQANDVAKILIFANLAPVAMHGYQLSLNLELGNCIVSYGVYWTTALTLPINLIWTGIINGTHLFD